jgi:group II intron reverse transcriptase/maturase
MSAAPEPQGKATYLASQSDKDWLLTAQRKLYARSHEDPAYVFCELWGLITDLRNLRCALSRVASNRGRRTAGVDGVTVKAMLASQGAEAFLTELRTKLRDRSFQPSPARRVLIPKPGQPGKHRPLGIPTVTDRVVQAALKNILEPIFEADFYPSSFGFRPARNAHQALEKLRLLLDVHDLQGKRKTEQPRLPYQWAIEGDIKGCFDNISHHGLMQRVRRRVGDNKVNRLVLAFLKAGVLSEEQFLRTEIGTPQGGILSPLLANIALAVIDERYARWVWPRHDRASVAPAELQAEAQRNRGKDRSLTPVFVPIRYADDFIILVSAPPGADQMHVAQQAAIEEKAELAKVLGQELGLQLSEEKTLVTPVTAPMRFLGHHVRVQYDPKMGWSSKVVIPKDRTKRLRAKVRLCLASGTHVSLKSKLVQLNPVLRGWSGYYQHARGAKEVLNHLDFDVWRSVAQWLRRKHSDVGMKRLFARYGWRKPNGRAWHWCDGPTKLYEMAERPTGRYRLAWFRPANFASTSMESPVHSERCTSGSVRGARKPTGASRSWRRAPI